MAPYTPVTRPLRDTRGVVDAVLTGLAAMIGAGLFAGLGPASALVGGWLPVAFGIAAVPAVLFSCCTADQASVLPGVGGGYRYTREQLGRWPGRMAGGLHLISRAAAAAALAGCFGDYVAPNRPALPAIGLLVVVVALDTLDVRVPQRVTTALTIVVLVVLVLVVIACFAIPSPPPTGVVPPAGTPGLDQPASLLPAAGLLFFAFLGFERATAPGGERLPGRRLRVVVPALTVAALGTYVAVTFAVLHQLGPVRLALSTAPLRDALDAADAALLDPVVAIGAAVACAVGLLLVIGGGRRTAGAMTTSGDLPLARWLIAGGAVLGVLVADPGQAMTLAATCALFYYAFTNASARLLRRDVRTWPGRTACFGLGVTVLLGMSMPIVDLAIALLVTVVAGLSGPLLALARPGRR
jgi:APA family basic amino acid/polyamine antiporter